MNPDLTLPFPAEALIPHRPPMRLIERLLSFKNGIGIAESISFHETSLFDTESSFKLCIYTELMAQAFAAVQGYHNLLRSIPVQRGFLVGIRNMTLLDEAHDPGRILILTTIQSAFGGFVIADGEILCKEKPIASGSIKLWAPDSAKPKTEP
ncbi:MAG: hypothetical protein AB1659_01540 [Thermodesulfobacteriota bacterium]